MLRLTIQVAIAMVATAATAWAVCSIGRSAYERHAFPRATEGQCFTIEAALELYHLDYGRWPAATTNEEYTAVLYKPKDEDSERAHYLLESSIDLKAALYTAESPPGSGRLVLEDLWDSEFSITTANDRPRVVSPGPDRALGTSDDITADRVRKRFAAFVEPRRESRMAFRDPPPGTSP